MAPIDNNGKNLSNDDSEYTSYEIAQRKKEAEAMIERLIDREVKLQIKALEEKRKEKDDIIKQMDRALEELRRQLEALKNENKEA